MAVLGQGDAWISPHGGLQLNGDGDFLSIANFDYGSDGDFTIALWVHKPLGHAIGGGCFSTSDFEHVYSHQQFGSGPHTAVDDVANSNVNIMLSCQSGPSGRVSTAESPILRLNVLDRAPNAFSWLTFRL